MRWVPFTAHIKIFPQRPGKRFEYVRELQKIATLMFDALDELDELNLASPGGGQQRSHTQHSGLTNGMAVKPQFGNTPPQTQITGFYQVDSPNAQPHPDKQLLHTGSSQEGPAGGHAWAANPTSTIEDEVADLKTLIEDTLSSGLPGTMDFTVFRLEYSGIVWGDRGHHFPR